MPARQPSSVRRRGHRRVEGGVDHQREQLVLGRDVAVERHRGRAELRGDAAHRDRRDALGRRHLHGRAHDPLQVEARLRALARAPAQAPGLLDAGRQPGLGVVAHCSCSLTAYALRCIAYGTRRRRQRHDRTGDRGDRDRQVLRRADGAGRRRPAGRARHASSPCSAPTAPARRRWCGSSPRSCARTPGRARVAGFDVVEDQRAVRHAISLTGQYAAVDELQTGDENLRMMGRLAGLGRAAARTRARELLARFDLSDAAGRRVATYSGGMRRRLDLAASLVAHPSVIFLDEPTTGLDPRSRLVMWDVITGLVRLRRHRLPDHAVPRGGRSPGRSRRRPRRRPRGRGGHAGAAQATDRRPAPGPRARRRLRPSRRPRARWPAA